MNSATRNSQLAILTLDIGTSSLRAMLFDANARAVKDCAAQIQYEMRMTPDGGVEFDADALFDYAVRAVDEVLAKAGASTQIAAVASASLAGNVLGVNAEGRAVTPMYTYADSRGAREVAELRARFDERATHQRVGTLFHTSYLPARLLWLARERAEEFHRARYWMSFGEYLLFRWLGQRACSYSVAAWTGLLNRAKLAWDEELVSQLPITVDQLSPLTDFDAPTGALREEYASRWRALREAKFFPTLGDGATANIGSGCINASRVGVTIGTSSAVRVARAEEQGSGTLALPFGLWSYRVTRDIELLGGALSEGGNLFAWMNDALQLDAQNIERDLAALPPDAHGLTVLPFLAGERAPNWNADARGAILGLNLNTRAIDILRAGMESVAYRLGLVFELLREVAPTTKQVIASGGALMKSPTWIQIVADTLGVPVIASAEPEATSRGSALLALKALGVIHALDDLPASLGAAHQPDAARHAIYARAMARQQKWYDVVVKEESSA
jgi:gluconokinase